jgi:hypothetical protein
MKPNPHYKKISRDELKKNKKTNRNQRCHNPIFYPHFPFLFLKNPKNPKQ